MNEGLLQDLESDSNGSLTPSLALSPYFVKTKIEAQESSLQTQRIRFDQLESYFIPDLEKAGQRLGNREMADRIFPQQPVIRRYWQDVTNKSDELLNTQGLGSESSSFQAASDFRNPLFKNETLPEFSLNPQTQFVTVDNNSPTISVLWDKAVQLAVINAAPGPTVASRAYGILHTAMFDAWAAYDPVAISTQLGDDLQRSPSENTIANKTEAMSYAAYRVLTELFPEQSNIFDTLMADLGFALNNATTDATSPAGIGNLSAEALMAFRRQDGSNQLGNDPNGTGVSYSDNSGYTPFNNPGESVDISRWTPELVPIGDESGTVQQFLTPQWGKVTPFGLESGNQFRPEAPQPFLAKGVNAEVDLAAKTITLDDGKVLPITRDLIGPVINPEFVAQAERLIDVSAKLTDEQKLIAEFWEDGGGTSFPPGTWMTFGQFVSARDHNSLDTDAQLFFALGNGVFDAGIATWEAKASYDYVRPVRAIRDLGKLGLVGEFDQTLGGFAINAWAGPSEGTQRILATDFLTYQTPGADPSPPFPEYTSGHSAFSASGAEILKLFTGSDSFGGAVTFESGESRFEPDVTPKNPLSLYWSTFTDAADEAGLSRIFGGIHFDEGDLNGRTLGRQVGNSALDQALFFINGGQDVNSVVGDNENNLIRGTRADDRVVALSGNDFVRGQRGKDQLLGGEGNDALLGGRGDDTLQGGTGQDILIGGRNADILLGGSGRDLMIGGSGNDLLLGGGGRDTLRGNRGKDGFVFGKADGTDIVYDFKVGTDFIGLLNSLTFDDLDIFQRGRNAVLGVAATDKTLALLRNVTANHLTEDQFISTSDISELTYR